MTLATVAGSVDSDGALPATLAYPGAMREEDYTNQPASFPPDQSEGIVRFGAREKPRSSGIAPCQFQLVREKPWIPHRGFWTARFYTGKAWIGIEENIHLLALKRPR
jgi:hypothetical protein